MIQRRLYWLIYLSLAALNVAAARQPDGASQDALGNWPSLMDRPMLAKTTKSAEVSTDAAPQPEAEAPPPAPIKSTKAEWPTVHIQAPPVVQLGHLVHVSLIEGGGAVRDREVTIDPTISDDDLVMTNDGREWHFTAPPGIYTIRALLTGKEAGFCRQEARIKIEDSRPAPAAQKPVAARGKPDDMLRQWVNGVNSRNREAETREIARAARETAQAIRERRVEGGRAVEEWAQNAYLRMGASFGVWNVNPNGKSFFSYMGDMFRDNGRLAGSDPANLLENLATILEGR